MPIMNYIYKYLVIIIFSVIGFLLIFNFITPIICNFMPSHYAKSELVIDSLKSEKFKPEVVAFGSSVVVSGVNGYVLRDELNNNNVYNLAVPGVVLKDICGNFPLLPSTVQTVIIASTIDEFITETKEIRSSLDQDLLFLSYISKNLNLTKKSSFKKNFENRSCLTAGIQIIVKGILDDDVYSDEALSIVYPYPYPNNRTLTTYQRDVFKQNEAGNILNGKIINSDYIELLKRIKDYFNARGIDFIVYLSPQSPDIIFTTEESTKEFISKIEQSLPEDLHFINCFYSLENDDFYDAVHPNRLGADKISKMLAKYILEQEKAL